MPNLVPCKRLHRRILDAVLLQQGTCTPECVFAGPGGEQEPSTPTRRARGLAGPRRFLYYIALVLSSEPSMEQVGGCRRGKVARGVGDRAAVELGMGCTDVAGNWWKVVVNA